MITTMFGLSLVIDPKDSMVKNGLMAMARVKSEDMISAKMSNILISNKDGSSSSLKTLEKRRFPINSKD